jgi:hypothetical protein
MGVPFIREPQGENLITNEPSECHGSMPCALWLHRASTVHALVALAPRPPWTGLMAFEPLHGRAHACFAWAFIGLTARVSQAAGPV